MSRACIPLFLVVGCATLVLAACGRSSAPEAAGPATTAPAASSPGPAATASAAGSGAAAGLPGDHAQTRRYKIDIDYPRLPASEAALAKTLQDTGDAAKREFMQALPDPKKFPEFADRQLQLILDFSVAARMPAFVSIREKGMADTGGAHPIPVDGSFVYDTAAHRVIQLDDLFSDPAKARGVFSKMARAALQKKLLAKVPGGSGTPAKVRKEWKGNMRQMIEQGTQPTAENFSQFVVLAGAGDKASGLELIFPPYQVAPYVYGTQTVEVPVDAFADLLKPDYRDAFVESGD